MATLRQRFIHAIELRGVCPLTRDGYVGVVYRLARDYHRSPDLIMDDELKAYVLHMLREQKRTRSTVIVVGIAVVGTQIWPE